MDHENTSSARPLGYGELLWWRISEAASTNFVMVAVIDGAVDAERLRRAIDEVARVHPMLRAHVEPGKRPLFHFAERARIPLRVVARPTEKYFHQVVEAELDEAIPHDAPVLWRATLLRGESCSELLLTFNHAISDGLSAATVIRDVLAQYAGGSPTLTPMAPPKAYDDLLDRGRPLGMLARGASNAFSMIGRRDVSALPGAEAKSAERRERTRFLDVALDAARTARLVARCKRDGLTVDGLLSSVFLLAAYEPMNGGPEKTISLTSAMSVRPYLRGDHRRAVAYFATGLEALYEVGPGADAWTLAHLASARTTRQLTAEHVAFNLFLRRVLLALKRSGRSLIEAAPRSSRANIHLTNLGRLPIEHEYGELTLRRCFHVPSAHLARRPFVCLASASFRGELQLTFSYCEPYTDRSVVAAIADRYVRHLRAIGDQADADADAGESIAFNF